MPILIDDLAALRTRRSFKWRQYPADVIPLWVAETDCELAEPVTHALTDAVARSDTGYVHWERFGEAFASFAADRWGWTLADPGGATRLVPDVMRGVTEILTRCTERGDRVVINTPAYPPFTHWLTVIDRSIVTSPLADTEHGYRLDLDRLEADFAAGAAAYLLCNPHNPTGLVPTKAELATIAELARRYDVRVVSDEIHAPLVSPAQANRGATFTPYVTVDPSAVSLHSASKAFNLAGLKAAIAVAGPDATDPFAGMDEEFMVGGGLFGMLANEAAWLGGGPWLDQLLGELDDRFTLVEKFLAERLPAVRWHRPGATYLAWLDFRRTAIADDPAGHLLEEAKVALNAGRPFCGAPVDETPLVETPLLETPWDGFARLNVATGPGVLTEGLERIARALA